MTEVVQISDYEVVIDGQSYSAIAIPAADSGVVTAERNRLLKNLKLESLISNLLRAGELLTLAYNGVAGFGTLRGAVTSISDRLRVLAADCEITMQRFERSSRIITGNLRDCFKFLMNGREEAALLWLGKAGGCGQGHGRRGRRPCGPVRHAGQRCRADLGRHAEGAGRDRGGEGEAGGADRRPQREGCGGADARGGAGQAEGRAATTLQRGQGEGGNRRKPGLCAVDRQRHHEAARRWLGGVRWCHDPHELALPA